jgi:hypothetical protein
LQRIRAGLGAAAQGNRKIRLGILSWRDSCEISRQGWTWATHGLIGSWTSIFFEMEGLALQNRAGLVRLEVHGAAGKLELRIF